HRGEARVIRGLNSVPPTHEDHLGDVEVHQCGGGLKDPRLPPLGEYQTRAPPGCPATNRLAQRHVRNRAARASCTIGCTSPSRLPPKRAASRTREEERYVMSTAGTRKTVSRSRFNRRFISAIWNSYSKWLTARSPRTTMRAPRSRAKSASSP